MSTEISCTPIRTELSTYLDPSRAPIAWAPPDAIRFNGLAAEDVR